MLGAHLIKLVTGVDLPHAEALEHTVFGVSGFVPLLHSSFPSSHTADTAVGGLFAWALLRNRTAAALAVGAALAMAASRLLLGRHYLSDVLAGLALGMIPAAWVMQHFLLPRWTRPNEADTRP